MHESYKKWLDDGKSKVICQCGCNQEIIIKDYCKWYGITKYIHGHQNKGDLNPAKRPEVKEKIRLSKLRLWEGKNNPMYDVHRFGEENPMFGKHHTEDTKRKISEAEKGKIILENQKILLSKLNSGENNPRFNNWSSRKPYCEKWTPELKEEVRNQYNRKCYLCDKDEKNNIIKGKQEKLSVHHIDNDKEQGCNGKKWKLIPLCRSCHTKIHNKKLNI